MISVADKQFAQMNYRDCNDLDELNEENQDDGQVRPFGETVFYPTRTVWFAV